MLKSMNGDKALGLDGFSISFFKKCREIIKGYLLKVFDELYAGDNLYHYFNNTFLVFIPKKKAKELKDYWPISLLGSVYKIVVKVFITRLKGVMMSIVSDPQRTFVVG